MRKQGRMIFGIALAAAAGAAGAEDLTRCLQGWQATQARDFDRAISHYDACVATGQLTPASMARTYRNYAITYRLMRQPQQAIEASGRALGLAPRDPWNDYVNRGNAYSDMGRFDEALADFERAAALQPNLADIHYNRGIVFERQNAIDKARAEFLAAYGKGMRTQQLQERLVATGAISAPPPAAAAASGEVAAAAEPRELRLASAIRNVWQATQSCGKVTSTALKRHPDADAIQASRFVAVAPAGARFGIPELPGLDQPVVTLAFGDRSRGVVDHYVLIAPQDLAEPAAAVVLTEVPPNLDTAQKILAAAESMQRGMAQRARIAPQVRRLQGPHGEAVEVIVEHRIGSSCFPTSEFKLAPPTPQGRTLAISRFVAMKGTLVEFALVQKVPAERNSEEAAAEARRVMDGFWVGLQAL